MDTSVSATQWHCGRERMSGLPGADGKDSDHCDLRSARHPKAQKDPEGHGQNEYVRKDCYGRLDDVEAVVDAFGVGVLLQFWVPIALDRDALKQSREEDGDGVQDRDDHQHPYDPEN